MSKGTAAKGQKGKAKLHFRCRRCGLPSFHKKKKVCSDCGYGRSSRLRKYRWNKKNRGKNSWAPK